MRKQLILITALSLVSAYAFADDNDNNWKYTKVYSKISENESAIDDLDSRVQTNTNGIQSLQTQIQNLPTGGGTGSSASDPQTQVNTTAIGNLDTRVQANTNSIGSLTTQVQSNTTAIGNNSAQIQGNTANINGVSAEAQANTATNASQATQIQANTADIGGLTTLQGSVDGLSTQVGTIQSDAVNLSAQVQTNSNDIANNSARLDTLEAAGTGGGTPAPTPAGIDFTPYVTTMTSKEFTIINGGACTIARQQISRTDTASGADIVVDEVLTSGARDCTTYRYGYVMTADAFSQTSYTNLTLGQSYTFEQAGEQLTSTMETGKSFGFATLAASNRALAIIQKNTLLGIESIVIPNMGQYDNCLKMHSQITTTMMNDVEQISWICPGVGEVQRIVMDKGISQTRTYILTSAF